MHTNVNVKHVIMRDKITNAIRKHNESETDWDEMLDELCDLHSVSYQRELLSDCVHFIVDLDQDKFNTYDKQVDEFIKSLNCS